ncbi:L,D-transpeptidase family protein [Shewanella gaetbuli]|uniref:L,D-transpeptidase family protein n=1 Tax=Shewanella gaetbuli TaxID=220752 RepID=A0A9X2CM50_9GAMM|nr:L,D-transpeptidase family protein [Shewanella gaetbuli]
MVRFNTNNFRRDVISLGFIRLGISFVACVCLVFIFQNRVNGQDFDESESSFSLNSRALSSVSQSSSLNNVPIQINSSFNQQAIDEHIQLLALGTNEHFFDELLSRKQYQTDKNSQYNQQATEAIIQFWHGHGVNLPYIGNDINENIQPQGSSGQFFSLEPSADDFLYVTNHIRRLMWLDKQTQWNKIALNGLLRLGDGHRAIKQISQRLWLLGDLVEFDENEYTYGNDLAFAVKRFQQRHGLTADAVIGPKTVYWLNLTPKQRARMLAKNFIKKTIYLASLPERYLLVNIPSYEMFLVDDYQPVLHSRVIVGRAYRQTPIMTGEISNVVINPTWTVPKNLMRADILPKIRENGHYLTDGQFDVFDYSGSAVSKSAEEWQSLAGKPFPYRLVQKPGNINALGRYKFHFKNDSNIYLHDTPNKALFAESERALSSGCIRVEKVQDLARWFADNLIIDKRTWKRLQSDYHSTQWFAFHDTLPVHFVYWTAWVDSHHLAQFRGDIYQKNSAYKPQSIEVGHSSETNFDSNSALSLEVNETFLSAK